MKTAVCLASTLSAQDSDTFFSLQAVLSHVKVIGLDLFLGDVAWSMQLSPGPMVDKLISKGIDPTTLEFKTIDMKIVRIEDSKLSVYISMMARSKSSRIPVQYSVFAQWLVDSDVACHHFSSSAQGQ